MRIADAVRSVTYLFLDTTPIIYFVEENQTYLERVQAIFKLIDTRIIFGVSSVITLTEALTLPLREGDKAVEKIYRDVLLDSRNFTLVSVDLVIADQAARLRATYNLKTADAIQIATAIQAGCDAFLTNDRRLSRVTELPILILDDLELDNPTP